MVSGFMTIEINSKQVENMMSGYTRTLPECTSNTVKELAEMAEKTYVYYIINKSQGTNPGQKRNIQVWTGNLLNGTRAVQFGKNHWGVMMPVTGIMLDQMRPHKVSLKRGRDITRWAQAHNVSPYRGRAITVYRHPFINNANISIGRKVGRIVQNNIIKTIGRKGR